MQASISLLLLFNRIQKKQCMLTFLSKTDYRCDIFSRLEDCSQAENWESTSMALGIEQQSKGQRAKDPARGTRCNQGNQVWG